MDKQPDIESVVIAGGGVAALEAALALDHYTNGQLHTTVITPEDQFTYRPDHVREPFSGPLARTYAIDEVLAATNCTRLNDLVAWVDPLARIVHTAQGKAIPYDALLVATGAILSSSFAHALTFDPARLDDQLRGVIQDIESGALKSLAFVLPEHPAWPLPLYELALMTARRAYEMSEEIQVTLITAENAPLEIFGAEASRAVATLLDASGVDVISDSGFTVPDPRHVKLGRNGGQLAVDRVIAAPELHGSPLPGIARDASEGFVAVDRHSRVIGADAIYAAGDLTDFPIKHGGIAAQQADAAAQSIALHAGADIEPQPLVAELSAVLWGGSAPLYLSARVSGHQGTNSEASASPLSNHAAKIYAPFLAPRLEALDRSHVSVG